MKLVRARILKREFIQKVYWAHHRYCGSVYYRVIKGPDEWKPVPMDSGKWAYDWEFIILNPRPVS